MCIRGSQGCHDKNSCVSGTHRIAMTKTHMYPELTGLPWHQPPPSPTKKLRNLKIDSAALIILNVKSEVNDVSVFHNVIFTFKADFPRFFRFCFITRCHKVIVADGLSTDKSFLEIGMNNSGTFRSRHAFFKCPGSDFLHSCSEVCCQTKEIVRSSDEFIKS